MCGICGIYHLNNEVVDAGLLNRITKLIRHRGPFDEGFLLVNTSEKTLRQYYGEDSIPEIKAKLPSIQNDIGANLGFGFRRLPIIDLSQDGHQPMCNADQTLWIVFNGEIYNYIELREELRKLGHAFHSGTDTEVILEAYQEWGTDCLNKFNGIWSFAIWDHPGQLLFCSRDRFGIKPFAYYFDGRRFIFGSEIKQLLACDIDKTINETAIYKYLKNLSYMLGSEGTFFKNISLLPHAHYMILQNGKLSIHRYFDIDAGSFGTSKLTFEEACGKYSGIFQDSIRLRMRSDVEVGMSLSGGVDSSAIVAAAVHHKDMRYQTFSSYYTNEATYDERKWIQLVTERFSTRPHYISADPLTVAADLEKITWHHDYPIASSSVIAGYYVMKSVRENGVTVILDGQGSDELTGGYNHAFYRYYAQLLKSGKLMRFMKEYPDYLKYNKKGSITSRLLKLAAVFFLSESMLFRHESKKRLGQLFNIDVDFDHIADHIRDMDADKLSNFLYNLMMSSSIQTLLHFVDRNSMSHSIESREPFLDYRLVELAFSLPPEYKVNRHLGKFIHREALRPIVPKEITERKDKVGFIVPGERYWMRNELKLKMQEIFASRDFNNRSIYKHKMIKNIYRDYLNGNNKYSSLLWQIMALEIWFRAVNKPLLAPDS